MLAVVLAGTALIQVAANAAAQAAARDAGATQLKAELNELAALL